MTSVGVKGLSYEFSITYYVQRRLRVCVCARQVRVVDAPRVAYRGVMIDVARNFLDKHYIFRLLDVLSMYKMNVLHLHLSDDQGWRLEVPALPELTDV